MPTDDEHKSDELQPILEGPPAERASFLELTRNLTRLPLEHASAAIETGAAIASVSLRAGVEFLRAAPEATQILKPPELRAWGELGRRLAMNDVDAATQFFATGVKHLTRLPTETLPLLFQLCARQMMLSVSIAQRTFYEIPKIATRINEPPVINAVVEIATEIARRSAKHSAEFLSAVDQVIKALRGFKDPAVVAGALSLTSAFAVRAGGISADAWTTIPVALRQLSAQNALRLLTGAGELLERGGGVSLQVLSAGGEILRLQPNIFAAWMTLVTTMGAHGNATLVAFVRSSPRLLQSLNAESDRDRREEISRRVIELTLEIARIDGEAALACFRSAARALRGVSIEQFEDWARHGLALGREDSRIRRSYFALETRSSFDALHSSRSGVTLEHVQHLLRLYIEALTGSEVEIAPLAAVPSESRINDGRTIHLPAKVEEFGDVELDFRLYKALAAHAAGQIEFQTHEPNTPALRSAYRALSETYDPANVNALDAFALDGYINDLQQSEAATSQVETLSPNAGPRVIDYRSVLQLFPHPQLARRIFGTLENGRIDQRLRRKYRGLRRDLDLVRSHLKHLRPRIAQLPASLAPFELLFQVTLLGGATDDAREYYRQAVTELETIVADYLSAADANVADTLMATSRVYSLFQSITESDESVQQLETQEEPSEDQQEEEFASERMPMERGDRRPERRDARELFNAWNDPSNEGEPDELTGSETWTDAQTPEQALEAGEVAFNYDEWDRELTDHRLGWCRVIEKQVKTGSKEFVEVTRDRYRGIISSIRHQFQLLKPEELTRVANEFDGEEFDLNSVVDYIIDRRADGQQSERLYVKRLRRQRDVAVSFLLDQSSSTARTIGRHPLQPYTRPGRRIIEIEKEGLVLMSEALEAVGDVYSINGFTSEGRRNVKFYVVKDFGEQYSDEVKMRIGGITYQNNTRLGAAIRHATTRLSKQDARTRLLIILSDGRPYDHDYGDARYAREDTREALRQAKIEGITPFCITIDRESETELRDLYGEVGYTIIDDVLSLPERLPGIYRRLTT
jgi:nitric oxide reductase activation protein